MFAVILVQTAAPHFSVIDVEQDQKVHSAMPLIFKLLALDLSRPHGLCRAHPLERLNIGLLIQRQSNLVFGLKRLGPFI